MGQKVHPRGFRLGVIEHWDSKWFARREYADLLHEDLRVRKFIKERLYHAGISKIEIERAANKAKINIHTARPGIVIGKKGAEIDKLKGELAKLTKRECFINIHEVRRPDVDAQLVAENVAMQLERRVAFRRAMKEAVGRRDELWGVRNFHQAFESGLFAGMLDAGVQMVTGGRGHSARRKSHEDHATTAPLERSKLTKPVYDDKLALDKLTDVYWSGAIHEEDQPRHLVVTDPAVCGERCTAGYGNPCQHFCPASVYNLVESPAQPGRKQLELTPSNCVHCKTCDIADPYQVIRWVTPQGGEGPNYANL